MFSVESYLTPYIAAYLGKYVDNFNKSNFQVSLWEGGATFQNVDLNLGAVEAELEIPFHVISGHIHEMKISVPWTKITSEPIVITLNTFELSLGLKRKDEEAEQEVRRAPLDPSLPPDTTGYMQGLMNKIIQNAKVVCHNVILKYIEEDIVISLNFENMTLCSVNNVWEQAFVDVGGTDFIVRRKLTCPDLTVCLDNVHSVSRHSFMEPLLYKCSFDVRIFNQFQGPFSKVPFFRRLDILFNEAEVSISEEQIPMLIRLYNLMIALTQLKVPSNQVPASDPTLSEPSAQVSNESTEECRAEVDEGTPSPPPSECDTEESSPLYDWASWAVGWLPLGSVVGREEPEPQVSSPMETIPPLFALGLCINSAHCTFKSIDRLCDRASTTSSTASSRIKTNPYLKCHIQGIVVDIVLQGVSRSVRGGFCEVRLEGVGVCPCGLNECSDEKTSFHLPIACTPYLVLGTRMEDFAQGTLFDPCTTPSYGAYDCRFHCKGYEDRYSEDAMLRRTPALALDSVEILPPAEAEECCETPRSPSEPTPLPTPVDSNFRIAFEKAGPKTSTRILIAPLKVRISSAFLHRLKVITGAVSAYNYVAYASILSLYIPQLRFFLKLRVDSLELILCDSESGHSKDTNSEIRLQLHGIKTNVDVTGYYRKNYFQLHSIQMQSFKRDGDGQWIKGQCLGVVMSSAQELEPNIQIPKSVSDTSGDHHQRPLDLSSSTSVKKLWKFDERVSKTVDSFLAISYTEVQVAHYQRNTLSQDLPATWNNVLETKAPTDSQWHVSAEQEEKRTLAELDVKVKALDLFFAPSTISALLKIAKEVTFLSSNTRGHGKGTATYTSANMPLAYLITQRFRIFFATDIERRPNTLLLQIPSITLTSQVDNALHRRCLRPDLLGLGEEAGITTLPGSFLEERRYEVSFSHISLSTCKWEDVEVANSNQPAPPLVSLPIFQQSELVLLFSPALVFQRHGCKPILVAGYGAEMNLTREIHVTANTLQIALLSLLVSEWIRLKAVWDSATVFRPEPCLPQPVQPKDCSLVWEEPVKEADSGVESSLTPHAEDLEVVPLDLFLAATNIRISTYHLDFGSSSSGELDTGPPTFIKPLLMLNMLRPYCACSIASTTQKLDISIFDLTAGMGSGLSRPFLEFTLPTKFDFPVKLFETLPGERNAKTGLLRPFLNLTSLNFLQRNLNLTCDIGRPIKFVLSKERLHQFSELQAHVAEYLIATPRVEPRRELNVHRLIALVSSYVKQVGFSAKQIVVVIVEEPPGLPRATVTASMQGFELGMTVSEASPWQPTETTRINFSLRTFLVTTLLGDKTDVVLNPLALRVRLTLQWHSFIDVPLSAINFCSDPVRIFLGPQNILAFLQVYHSFGDYLRRFIAAEEKEIVEILEAQPVDTTEVNFDDDLRNGAFHYVYASAPNQIQPAAYQVIISQEERSLTWRYPVPRMIKQITTHRLPAFRSSLNYSYQQPVELECSLSYWDEAQWRFVVLGSFFVSEWTSEEISFGVEYGTVQHVSTIWRITIQTAMEEEELRLILTPEGLGASLCVKSTFARSKVPKVVLVSHIPRIAIHLINQRTHSGKIPEEMLRHFSMDGLHSHMDQPFATLELSCLSFSASVWMQRARVEARTSFSLTVTDYGHLTDLILIDPTNASISYSLVEKSFKKVHEGVSFVSDGLVVKLGQSALHTLITSTLCWIQVLKAYYGDVVDTSKSHFQTCINMTRIIVANDTTANLTITQALTKKPLLIPSRHAYAFTWTTQKVKAEVVLGLADEVSKKTLSFQLDRIGTLVRRTHEDTHFFITTQRLHPAQLFVRVSSCFDVANFLEVPIVVGLLGRRMGQEQCWTVESRSHGPSLLISARDVAGIRFRLTNLNGRQHGWSHSLTTDDLRTLPNQSKCIALYEESDGDLTQFNIWVVLVEEMIDGAERSLIVLSPFYRICSYLPRPTTATISTKAQSTSFVLQGRGSEAEVDFRGDESAAHLLTFQSDSAQSSPPIPLLAGGGPCLSASPPKPNFETILKCLMDCDRKETARKWPFTREALEERDWLEAPGGAFAVQVTFKPWIPGLPSVLVEAKPEALLANLTGQMLLFRQEGDDFSIQHRSAFAPTNIRGKFAFGFNLSSFGGTGVVWSDELEMSDHPSPAQIHHVNSDWKIPLNCLSRLELDWQRQQIHLTIESCLHEGIVLLTLRSTFNIQNKTKFPLFVSGFSMLEDGVAKEEVVGSMDTTFITLEGTEGERKETAQPLLLFNCDWNPKEKSIYKGGVKYLALRYAASPAWFIRLMKFEPFFDNISHPQGVPVKRITTAIPTTQPHWNHGSSSCPLEVTLPLSIAWTCKDGQVWVSIQLDSSPQVVIVNDSQVVITYAEPGRNGSQVLSPHFPQLPLLGPFSTAFFAFPSSQATFPEIGADEKGTLVFGLSALPSKLLRLATMLSDPEAIEWSQPVKFEDCEEVQLVPLSSDGRKVYLKVIAEKLGSTHYIFIEELSGAEVSARDVRARILGDSSVEQPGTVQSSEQAHFVPTPVLTPLASHQGLNTLLSADQLALEIVRSNIAVEAARPSVSKSQLDIPVGTEQNPFLELRIHFPQIRVILMEEVSELGQRREIISLNISDLFVERRSKHGDRPLRVLGNLPAESWLLKVWLGTLDVDNALFREKRYDFPVLFQRSDAYRTSRTLCGPLEDDREYESIRSRTFAQQRGLLTLEAQFLSTSPEGLQTLQSIEVKCEPIRVNLEDKFLAFVIPLTSELTSIVRERLPLLQADTELLHAQRLERHSRDSLDIIFSKPNLSSVMSSIPNSDSPSRVFLDLVGPRKLSWDSSVGSPIDSTGVVSPSVIEEAEAVIIETELGVSEGPLYADIGEDYVNRLNTKSMAEAELEEVVVEQHLPATSCNLPLPDEIMSILQDLANPVQLQRIHIHQVQTHLTFRGTYGGIYFAFDNSPLLLNDYAAQNLLTTRFHLGRTLAGHFLLGAIYRAGNPMRILGSLELIGSPGTLARSVGVGVKDFVMYPLRGITHGPLAFLTGLNSGSSSLLRNVSSGALTSLTNFAWSVSRNLDRLTLDEDEELVVEEGRRVAIDGISDGLLHGFTAFGIRLLGAIGGVVQHPMQAVIDEGSSPLGIARGVGKGLIGVVTKPLGATVELVAMTGQGLLQEAGWAHKFTRREAVYLEVVANSRNSILKYAWKLGLSDPAQEKLLLMVEALELGGRGKGTPVSLLITTDSVYVMDTSLDQVQRKESISSTMLQPADFEIEPIAGAEFFNLLSLLKSMQDDDIFKVFHKTSTSY